MDINLSEGNLKLWQTMQFLVRLIVLSMPLYLVIAFSLDLTLLQNFFAQSTAHILSASGWNLIASGNGITVLTPDNFIFLITPDCTAWKSMLFLFALLFAVPRKPFHPDRLNFLLKSRLPWLIAGIPAVVLANMTRILTSVWVLSAYGPELSGLVHDILWQFGLAGVVLGIWLLWLRKSYLSFSQGRT